MVNLDHTNILSLKGPFEVLSGKSNTINSCRYSDAIGVMFFAIPVNDDYYLDYIGHTGASFKKYVRGSIRSNIRKGEYRSLCPKEAKNGKCKVLWKGFWRFRSLKKTDPRKYNKEMKDWDRQESTFRPIIEEYLDLLKVFVVPLEGKEPAKVRKKKAQDLKGHFYRYFYGMPRNDPVVRFLPFDIQVPRRMHLLDHEKLVISNPEVIVGMPRELIID